MRKRIYILTILVGLLSACNSTDDKTNTSSTSRLLPEPDILERLKYQKTNIDALFNHSKDKLIVFAKLMDKDEPVQIKNGNFPDNVETTFNILKDSLGNIVTISEFPFNKSGDWNIIFTHYFDKDGKTFAFERQTNFFNSICTDGVAYETRTEFYNSDFQIIDKTYRLVDEKNCMIQKDSCQFPYDNEYKVLADIDIYLRTNKI
ncbi:hypothetical protein [Polluticaenibacter yanchengensis]|uniref:Lipoprotein n=1 Tax=Polluticaenibacter yanchengensis TaxID=3014562 RepID=A0ABT4UHS9_9BACT|nr:hypothetical protein [Chitinophagaceae bacterium LY-5]